MDRAIDTLNFNLGLVFTVNKLGNDKTLNLRSEPIADGTNANVIGGIPLNGDVIILPPPKGKYYDYEAKVKWNQFYHLNQTYVWYYVLAQVGGSEYMVGWCAAGVNEAGKDQWLYFKGNGQPHNII
ncbi:MAG: hypothetical protein AAF633_09125 [Chloroflexota bacterium]